MLYFAWKLILKNNNIQNSNKYFNRIYDCGDEHGIKIDTVVKTQTDVNAQIQPQEETQPQNNNLIKWYT